MLTTEQIPKTTHLTTEQNITARGFKPGPLMAIGGGMNLNGPILQKFYWMSGGPEACIVILSSASEPDGSGDEIAAVLSDLGLRCQPVVVPLRSRADAQRASLCETVSNATGLFITGDDQNRLMETISGTPLFQAVINLHRQGGVVAGTSAGAAALAEVMIVDGDSGLLPYKGIAQFDCGLGIINSVVFDQHFSQRNRVGRLLYTVACHPHLLGIGIDEDTAAIIDGDTLRVAGSGAVTLVDGSSIRRYDPEEDCGNSNLVPVSGAQIHLITRIETFDLRSRKPTA